MSSQSTAMGQPCNEMDLDQVPCCDGIKACADDCSESRGLDQDQSYCVNHATYDYITEVIKPASKKLSVCEYFCKYMYDHSDSCRWTRYKATLLRKLLSLLFILNSASDCASVFFFFCNSYCMLSVFKNILSTMGNIVIWQGQDTFTLWNMDICWMLKL